MIFKLFKKAYAHRTVLYIQHGLIYLIHLYEEPDVLPIRALIRSSDFPRNNHFDDIFGYRFLDSDSITYLNDKTYYRVLTLTWFGFNS